MSIKHRLLVGIIREYIKSREPIGSEFLKSQQNLDISSATIRNYCKILESEGALFQPHTSSGRIPTRHSLSSYWRETLRSFVEEELEIDMGRMPRLSRDYEIFCVAIPRERNLLEEVMQMHEIYLIFKFSRGELVTPFSEALFRFSRGLIGLEIQELVKVAGDVGAMELREKLLCLRQFDFNITSYRYGSEFIQETLSGDGEVFMDFYNAYALLKYGNGIYFNILPQGYLTIIHDISYLDRKKQKSRARMLCAGSLMVDYKNFYRELCV